MGNFEQFSQLPSLKTENSAWQRVGGQNSKNHVNVIIIL